MTAQREFKPVINEDNLLFCGESCPVLALGDEDKADYCHGFVLILFWSYR